MGFCGLGTLSGLLELFGFSAQVRQRIHARWFGAMIADSCPPRIIHISLSGGDRKAQAKGIRYAHGIHNSYFKESVLTRSAAEAKSVRPIAWNARRGTQSCGPGRCDHVSTFGLVKSFIIVISW